MSGKGAELEILPDRHRGKEPAALRDKGDAVLDNALRRSCADSFTFPSDYAGARNEQAGNRLEQSRLPGAIGADERNHFAPPNHQAYVVERE